MHVHLSTGAPCMYTYPQVPRTIYDEMAATGSRIGRHLQVATWLHACIVSCAGRRLAA